jgi:hypothetical protein
MDVALLRIRKKRGMVSHTVRHLHGGEHGVPDIIDTRP